MKTLIKNHFPFLIAFSLALLVRFTSQSPVIWMQDSGKYHIPLNVIMQHDWHWILDTLNPSLVTRFVNYFIQINDSGAPTNIIVFQKVLNLLSMVIFYLIALKLSRNKYIVSAVFALIFVLNPLLLFLEQTLMAEVIFVFFSLLSFWSFIKLIEKESIVSAAMFGLIIGIFAFVKDSSGLYILLIYAFFSALALYKLFFEKKKNFLLITLTIIVISQAIKLPVKFYNQKHFGIFRVNRYVTTGAVLWFLDEEMLRTNPPSQDQWLTNYLLNATQKFKELQRVPLDKPHRQSFYAAVISINSPGRMGGLTHPETGLPLSTEGWNKIAVSYWLETIKRNPELAMRNLWENINEYLFQKNLYYTSDIIKSIKAETEYEASLYSVVPFSLKDKFDPALKGDKIVEAKYLNANGSVYQDSGTLTIYPNVYPLMINTNTPYLILVPEQGLSVMIQKPFKDFPLSKILLPLFLIAIIMYFNKELYKARIKDLIIVIFMFISAVFFLALPVLIHGEPRYQVQFFHFMLLFIAYVFAKYEEPDIA